MNIDPEDLTVVLNMARYYIDGEHTINELTDGQYNTVCDIYNRVVTALQEEELK